MARYGSPAIRGHGIPEAMEQILTNGSRIPARLTFLKPLSAAVAIGTGGPFGAEGPIIATGSAFGSLVGQLLHTTAAERKTLLAAGAAAGMAATFGSPVSAVLLAVELLLFEFRARSLIPVALASAAATGDPGARLGELIARPPLVAFADSSLREATDHRVRSGVGRLPVVERAHPGRVVGMLTRSDVLAAQRSRLHEATHAERTIAWLKVVPKAIEAKDA